MNPSERDNLIALIRAKLLELNGKGGQINFSGLLNLLKTADSSLSLKLQKHPALSRLNRALNIEAAIDFKKAGEERDELITRLGNTVERQDLEQLVSTSLSFKQNEITPAVFHQYLLSLVDLYQLDRSEISNLEAYGEYLAIFEAMDFHQVLPGLEALALEVIRQLESPT